MTRLYSLPLPLTEDNVLALIQELTADGLHVEAAWIGYLAAHKLDTAPEKLRQFIRRAFFYAATFTFSSMVVPVEPGEDGPPDAAVERIQQMADELHTFAEQCKAQLESEHAE